MEATSIANLLDEEPDVSRYYAELVPARISPEEFWSRLSFLRNNQSFASFHCLCIYRYFFRLKHVNDEDLSKNEEDEDEEELTWESSEQGSPCDPSPSSSPKTSDLESLEIENKNLKSKMLMLIKRIEDLEADLQNKNGTIEDLQRQLASATCRANRGSENEINNICDASKNMTNEKDNKSNNEPDTNENENDQESVESVSSTGSSCVIVSSADLEDDTKLLESGASSKNSLVDLDDDEEASWS